jgi:hypothetical protein
MCNVQAAQAWLDESKEAEGDYNRYGIFIQYRESKCNSPIECLKKEGE